MMGETDENDKIWGHYINQAGQSVTSLMSTISPLTKYKGVLEQR